MAEKKFAQDQKSDIDAEILDAIQCKVCERDLSETKLYQCSLQRCPKRDDVFCKSCGNLSHLKIEGHSWRSSRREIKFKAVDPSRIQAGYVKLDLMIRNKRFVGWKETSLQITNQVGGQVSSAAAAYTSLLYGGNAARVNVQLIDLVVDVTNGVQHGSKALYAGLAKATPWAIVAAATIDIAVHSYRFWNGDIEDWHEFGWYCARSVTCASASGLAGWGGAAGGAAIGTVICPGVGTVCGAIIGGLLSSIIGGTLSSKGFERIWPNPVCFIPYCLCVICTLFVQYLFRIKRREKGSYAKQFHGFIFDMMIFLIAKQANLMKRSSINDW
eukprot:941297_1